MPGGPPPLPKLNMPSTQPLRQRLDAIVNGGVKWIMNNVPCFAGQTPPEWTDRVIAELRKMGMPDPLIGRALEVARSSGYEFASTPEALAVGYGQVFNPPVTTPPGDVMGAPKGVENRDMSRQRLEFLEAQLTQARHAGDTERAKRLAEEVAWLKYHLETSAQGGSQSNDNKGTVQGSDRPRSDGLQSERPGGAPLEPPPENRRRRPINEPIPPPDGGPRRGGGPYRVPGR